MGVYVHFYWAHAVEGGKTACVVVVSGSGLVVSGGLATVASLICSV